MASFEQPLPWDSRALMPGSLPEARIFGQVVKPCALIGQEPSTLLGGPKLGASFCLERTF